MSNSYGTTYQNPMVVIQQMIDEAIRSREIKTELDKTGTSTDNFESNPSSYSATLSSIKDKLEGNPSFVILREDVEDVDLLTGVVSTYPSGYYTRYDLVYVQIQEFAFKTSNRLDNAVFSIYNEDNEQVLSISIGLNYNSRGHVESIDVNDGSWE